MNAHNSQEGVKSQQNVINGQTHVVDCIEAPENINSMNEYTQLYKQSIHDPQRFWGVLARSFLTWDRDFHTTQNGSFTGGDVSWFLGGRLNASFNCIDRHALRNPNKIAINYVSDDGTNDRSLTYRELLAQVCSLAGTLRAMGVNRGDVVTIYLPMIPEAAIAMLACARIGAVHSVVFAGFSADALADRIVDARSRVLITADEGRRGGKAVRLKEVVDEAVAKPSCTGLITSVLVHRHVGVENLPWTEGRDRWWHEEQERQPRYIEPVSMPAEDPLFLLYTSGSTGKPKGVQHNVGGYLLGAATTGRYVLGLGQNDRLFCAGDVGWITGHTYAVYSPLILGATTVIFEGTPVFPTPSRYWEIVDKLQVTHFYAAPTALRLLKRLGNEYVTPFAMQHLRVLASVGEPIAPEVWTWYHDVVGRKKCSVVDTYWQTETGSHVIAPLTGVTPTKPGAATLPFFGIEPVLLEPVTGTPVEGDGVEGVLAFKQPWPSMARTILGDHKRFVDTYLKVYEGYYFTGDRASRDADGHYWILGRVDDVINVSGHRLSTAEIEAALLSHASVAEAAVVGVNDELTGQAVVSFISITTASEDPADLAGKLRRHVRESIGAFASPKKVVVVDDLPKTRSGKIMRRILRKIAAGEQDQLGDLSTLADPSVVERIIQAVNG